MNLQRDTDHALRIIICIVKLCSNKAVYRQGISMYNICIQTGVQKINASRICDTLCQKGLLVSALPKDGSTPGFLPAKDIEKLTLLELIDIIEGNTNIFALFNTQHKFMEPNKTLLMTINNNIDSYLSQVCIRDFL